MKKQAFETMKSTKQAGFIMFDLLVVIATTAVIYGYSVGGGSGDAVARFLGR